MPFTTQKLSGDLPEIAIIRKGEEKQKVMRNGREVEVVGPDLNDRFRVVFAPGADTLAENFSPESKTSQPKVPSFVEAFMAEYKTMRPKVIRAMLTLSRAMDCWEGWNEAYSAGRRIAQADGDHYISKRNPVTGKYEVSDGEPYTPWHVGDVITYAGRNGSQITLKFRTTGRLKLFLPYTISISSVRLVHFLLKTTSFYDCLNIEKSLLAIQNIADTLNNGNAAGIPLVIYRRPTNIVWNHVDGGASRENKWLVYIEADPTWVADAMRRMRALADGKPINLLPSGMSDPEPEIVAGENAPDPSQEDDLDPEEGDVVDGEYADQEEATDQPEVSPETNELWGKWAALARRADAQGVEVVPFQTMPAPEELKRRYDELETQLNAPKNGTGRPMDPAALRRWFAEQVVKNAKASANADQTRDVASCLDYLLRGKGARYEFLSGLAGKPISSSKDLPAGGVFTLFQYLKPYYNEQATAFVPAADVERFVTQEVTSAHAEWLKDNGQGTLFG